LTYKEQRALEAQQRELAELPHMIERLEAEQHRLSAAMAEPAFYQREGSEIAEAVQQLKDLEEQLAAAYQRWAELES
jgi:ATP-binding cassette subfamily F protein uup